MIIEAIKTLSSNKDLSASEMSVVMEEIMSGQAETPNIVSFLTALNAKGETIEEITAAVSVMRVHSVRITTKEKIIFDTCGTGGDRKGTFNISTAVGFVVSGCGITVAKHGNRAVSSSCGSADILEALGININMDKEKLGGCLDEIGIAFLFAPSLHPAMKYAMPARKQMGVKTIFNILGPLSNPAGATHQLIGVYDRAKTGILAQVLNNLGTIHALIVHGEDGLDELTTTAKSYVSELYQGEVRNYQIAPEDFGIKKADSKDLLGANALDNAKILLDILNGKTGPCRDIVVLNAAAAIYAADKTGSVKEGIALAEGSIDSKKALEKLELLREYSQKHIADSV
ncbi:MAG: anthranilate phosphoribosyltransferase [Candidatus Omnitrophota bacterium]